MATLLVPTLHQALQGLGLGVDAAGGAAGSNLGLHNLKIFPKGRGRADVTQGCGVGALTAVDPPTPSPTGDAASPSHATPPPNAAKTSPPRAEVQEEIPPEKLPATSSVTPRTKTPPQTPSAAKFRDAIEDARDFENAMDEREGRKAHNSMKRPASVMEPASKAKQKPSKSRKGRPPLMKNGDETVYYCAGKVNRNEGTQKFRVFLNVGDRTDKSVSFKTIGEAAAWKRCCEMLEAAES